MTMHEWLGVAACAGHLALAILVLLRRTRTELGLVLTLLCADMFAWNFFDLAYRISKNETWHWLDVSVSWLTPSLGYHLVVIFVGKARPLRGTIIACYAAFAALEIGVTHPSWDVWFLCLILAVMGASIVLLILHLVRTTDGEERTRTQLLLAAVTIGTVLGSSDLWYDRVAFPIPALGNISTLLASMLVAMIVLRFGLFGGEIPAALGIYSLGASVLSVLGYLAVFRWLGTQWATLVLGTVTLAFLLLVFAREIWFGMQHREERTRELATVGRFSQQMAHDLRNPMAALKGALQFLEEEHKQGRPLDRQREFLELMLEQVDRVERVIGQYQRLGRVTPSASLLRIDDVVRGVLGLQAFAASANVRLVFEPSDAVPPCSIDGDLVARMVENLVRNAFEAMPEGGTVTVRTAVSEEAERVLLSVEDEGTGMDPRVLERAFDDFYTTKASGTGLGLPFVRRVAEAHGGSVSLASQLGRGTTVRVALPIGPRR
jgi:two-component system, NtrC family, sensor histidine kinase HydH